MYFRIWGHAPFIWIIFLVTNYNRQGANSNILWTSVEMLQVYQIHSQVQLFPILLINLIGTLGFSIVLPVLVFLVKNFGGNAIVFGILSAIYPAFQLIGAPILGKWSDTYGRKKILLLSNAGSLIGWIFFLVALFLPKENSCLCCIS